ncbi:MAG: hypothetical protein ACTSPY_00175 [Candidatus Helarchaeota archaeon]
MDRKKKNYLTAHQIDGHKGIKSPHARELEEMGKEKASIFEHYDFNKIKGVIENKIHGKIENIDFGEDYTITLEMFPEVKIHILYFNYEEDEDDAFGGSELRFLFSGNRVNLIPTEDLIGYIEAVFYFMENLLQTTKEIFELPVKKSNLLEMAIDQRLRPFEFLKNDDLNDLAIFIGGDLIVEDNNWSIQKKIFQGFHILLTYYYNNKILDIEYRGRTIEFLNNYSRDQLGIFLLNHCLRFLLLTYPDIEFLKIVKQTFSYSYLKSHF